MTAELAIAWMKATTAVSGPLPPETSLWLRSSGLATPPTRYQIYRVNPKPWWRFFGRWCPYDPEMPLDAVAVDGAARDPGGVYRSASDWKLGGPNNQTGRADFQAWTDGGVGYSGIMSSASLWIATVEEANSRNWEAGGEVASTGLGKLKAKLSGKATKKLKWKVRAPKDPAISIQVLQGRAVLNYLSDADAEIAELNTESGGSLIDVLDGSGYFETEPLEDESFEASIGPDEGFDVEAELPLVDGLRMAVALEVRDQADGSVLARSDPLFVTNVGDRLVVTDLTADLLRDEPARVLDSFVRSGFDVNAVAAERISQPNSEDVAAIWRELVSAAEELGAGSVGDAAAYMATTGEAGRKTAPVPAGIH